MKTGHRRLLKLAQILQDVPRRRFNMYVWHEISECGTVACAAGWACMDKGFNSTGLKLANCEGGWLVPTYKGFIQFSALSEFFDLSYFETRTLFEGDSVNTTPKQVARKIERFVKAAVRGAALNGN